ncbi:MULTISPECIES: SGNH/GDSL hydrolase family protein [unclassified Microbulbifer]|uniref:SGNH/GDSL hydrolase family protein n=1 Tax=unclassified Microbulbifer TaxID=2619833 RepID=UPI0027E49DEF|nr:MULTISPECIES: SGNH/GDSL hydrolase family protein [unclassified Microbulbifer]
MEFNKHSAPQRRFLGLLLVWMFFAVSLAQASGESEGNWIATWTASPQPRWNGDFALPTNTPFHLWNQTLRQVARVSIGGERVRVVLSNKYGSRPLRIGAAHLALAGDESEVVPGSGHALAFSGDKSPMIPAGAEVVSDPVELAVTPLQQLAISVFLPEPTPPETFHWDGLQTAYIGAGNQVDAQEIEAPETTNTRIFLSGILVDAAEEARTVVAFGDSITDGNASSLNANHRWPDFLAARLTEKNIAVVNGGISGARLLDNIMGENALARFERDVLAQPGVETVIVLMGINDIGWPGSALAPEKKVPAAERLIAAYRQLITRTHIRGVRIIGATLTPFEGALDQSPMAGYYSAEKEKVRRAVNHWIRSSGEFDGVIDFDAITRDPKRPSRFLPAYDSGDHLHPGDEGYRAMAESIDLRLL